MNEARTEILERIRSSLGGGQPKPARIDRTYRVAGTRDSEARIELLIDRLDDYDATVRRVPTADVGQAVADFLDGAQSVVVPDEFPVQWLDTITSDGGGAEHPTILRDSASNPLDIETVDTVDAVVTGSFVAIADTGTIVLVGNECGRRAITLVPDHHVIVVRAADIVDIVPEGFRRIVDAGHDTAPITMVSGPSATVDIEFIRVHGVHGPRRLDVIIAE